VYAPDDGEICVKGRPTRIDSPQRATHQGISTVFQDLVLVNERDVAYKMLLGREPCRFFFLVDLKRICREAKETIKALRVGPPSVGALSGAQRQAIAVARAWQQGGQITLLDESTAALGVREASKVKDLMVTLRTEGHGPLLISHNLESVFELADRIVVLRHGSEIADMPNAVQPVLNDRKQGAIAALKETNKKWGTKFEVGVFSDQSHDVAQSIPLYSSTMKGLGDKLIGIMSSGYSSMVATSACSNKQE
jgi:ABC-type sugar transport system ATPase subunit